MLAYHTASCANSFLHYPAYVLMVASQTCLLHACRQSKVWLYVTACHMIVFAIQKPDFRLHICLRCYMTAVQGYLNVVKQCEHERNLLRLLTYVRMCVALPACKPSPICANVCIHSTCIQAGLSPQQAHTLHYACFAANAIMLIPDLASAVVAGHPASSCNEG